LNDLCIDPELYHSATLGGSRGIRWSVINQLTPAHVNV
jgi:hypothetical protein